MEYNNDLERLGGLLQDAIDMSGNEFAMGYDDSGCFWRFYGGNRGSGSMMDHAQVKFQSESPEIIDALEEYLKFVGGKDES